MPKHSLTLNAYCFPTAFGSMAIVWNEKKIVATQLPDKNEKALLASLRKKFHAPSLDWSEKAPAFVRDFAKRISKHLAGKPQHFPLEHLALEGMTPFFRKVYECAHRIPAGSVRTYGELAKDAGSPKAFRAVGQAMAKNPFVLVIPCHRVVGSTQALVGFSANGGVTTKGRLLKLESKHAGPANKS